MYLAFLCGRPLPGSNRCVLGRETSMQEVKWNDGWPLLMNGTNNPDDYFEVDGIHELNEISEVEYRFNNLDFLNEFQTVRIPYNKEMFSINENEGFLTLTGKESIVSSHNQSVICRRQMHFKFEAETKMKFSSDNFQRMAGLIYRYDESCQYYLYASYDETVNRQALYLMEVDRGRCILHQDSRIHFDGEDIFLKLSVDDSLGQYSYSMDGINWTNAFGTIDVSKLSDEYTQPMGFTGAFVGMACQDFNNGTAKALFEYFKYRKL